MNAQFIDFRGLIDLDKKIVEHLDNYLSEKEVRLGQQINDLILDLSPDHAHDFSAPVIPEAKVKLSEAVENFIRNVRVPFQRVNTYDKETIENIIKHLNAVLWDYTEALEGCIVELFQQIKQVSVDRWHLTIAEVVHSVKELLTQRIEDLIWTIRRLEEPLNEFCKANLFTNLSFWKKWNQSCLDVDLLTNLKKSYKYLQSQYTAFYDRHQLFTQLSYQIEEYLDSMKKFPVLARLDVTEQNTYVDVYRLLKLIEINPEPKGILAQESIRSLKYLVSVDTVYRILRLYCKELNETLFSSSLEYKSLINDKDSPYFEEILDKLKEKIHAYQDENLHVLQTIRDYRDFILKNDSNPYVSSRWGFTERTVGPEPITATKLLNLVYYAEEVNRHYSTFKESLLIPIDEYSENEESIHHEIDKLLHEMGQPLISQALMHNRAERLLEELKVCNELGSPHIETINYMGNILSKAMREDWKYHVLHEFNQFHEIYRVHLGLCPRFDDPSHAFRGERFQLFFNQIEGWVKKGDIFTHIHEIELDINDIKTYLQEFLATIQRGTKDKQHDPFLDEVLQKYRQQLLEYRYQFGQFFSNIMRTGIDGQQLRIQFLFVDQYFEAIENLIDKSQTSWKDEEIFEDE